MHKRTTLGIALRAAWSGASRHQSPHQKDPAQPSGSVVGDTLRSVRNAFQFAAAFSGAINVLMLSGSLFMLQVYDRVLPSRSIPTLEALVLLVLLLYAFTSSLELIRARLFARIGRHVDQRLGSAVFELNLRCGLPGAQTLASSPFRDLDQLRTFLAGGGPAALFDLPWTPLYALLLFLLHPWMGLLGLSAIALLAALAWRNDQHASPLQRTAAVAVTEANAVAEASRRAAETVSAMGMAEAVQRIWAAKNRAGGDAIVRASDVAGTYGGASRFFRTALQSMALALGAYLVISGRATGGVMIASSLLLGRALAPVELAIAHWRGFLSARQGYDRLAASLAATKAAPATRLPRPCATLEVHGLSVLPPGATRPAVRDVRISLQAGDALAVIGPSGSGKSTLARALVGVWPASNGAVRLDGSTLDQWSATDAGRFLGYLPQEVELFAGSVGQNIARFDPNARSEDVLRAAASAGLDSFIRGLSDGFDTHVGERGSHLSAGQRQRLGLARALYGDPFLIVLDEPNAALDADGEGALARALVEVRQRGAISVTISHRPNALHAINKVLVLAGGIQRDFGLRDEVLRRVLAPVRNSPAEVVS